jgi:hypothetical protein
LIVENATINPSVSDENKNPTPVKVKKIKIIYLVAAKICTDFIQKIFNEQSKKKKNTGNTIV